MILSVRSLALLVAMLLLVATGCGPSTALHFPVAGKVTVGDKPLVAGRVVFAPDKSKGNTSTLEASGDVAADGSYQVATAEGAGAPAGWYKIAVFARKPSPPDKMEPVVWLADMKYADASQSGLAAEVKPDAPSGAYDLQLEP